MTRFSRPLCTCTAAALLAALAPLPVPAADIPPPDAATLARQWDAFEAVRTKTVVELQPYRAEQTVTGPQGQSYRLTSLNPNLGAWYLLEVSGAAGGAPAVYHLENPFPGEQTVALQAGTSPALALGQPGEDAQLCRPWAGTTSALDEARAGGLPYAALCGGRLHLLNDVSGSRTSRERVAEFLRDNVWFGESIVNMVKSTFYADRYLESGEIAEAGDRGQVAAAIGAAAMADRPVMYAATGLRLDGVEGTQMEMGSWYAVTGAPGVYASAIKPGRIHPDILNRSGETNWLDAVEQGADVYLTAFDLSMFELGYVVGTEHPRVEWSPRPSGQGRNWNIPGPDGIADTGPVETVGMLNPVLADRVAATFNGGFKREHGAFKFGDYATFNHGHHYGFVSNGAVLSRLRPNLATFYTLADGTIGMKTWDEADDDTLLPRIAHARQNGVPLIVRNDAGEGVPGPRVRDWLGGNWYGNANAEIRTTRSGICRKEVEGRPFLIYGFFSSHTPSGMARTFQAYGCDYAMQLDMNALEHTYMAVYGRDAGRIEVQNIAQGMADLDATADDGSVVPRFVGFPDNRDFFYLLRKRAE